MIRTSGRLCLFALCSTLFLAPNARAEEGRQLGAHRFIPSTVVPLPFLTSYIDVEFTSGIAQGLTIPKYDADNNELSEQDAGVVSVMGGGFRTQIRLGNPISLRFAYGMNGRIGATAGTLLAKGVSAVWAGSLGLTVKILETESFYVSGTADLRRLDVLLIDPLTWAKGTGPLVTETFIWRGLGGLRAAWTARDWLGFTLFGEGGAGFSDEAAAFALAVGGQASINLEKVSGTPVGFTVTYKFEKLPNDLPEARRANTVAGGVFLSGRNDFVLGLEVSYAWLTDRNDASQSQLLQGRVMMRYDFF